MRESSSQTPRQESGMITSQSLATAAVIAVSTQAYGSPVRFDNTTGYNWFQSTLDLTKSSADQTYGTRFDADGTSVYLDYFSDFYPTFSYQHSYTNGSGAEIWNSGFSNRYSQAFAGGEQVGPGMIDGAWSQYSTLEFAFTSADREYVGYPYYYYTYTNYMSGYRGLLPADGSDTYIGVRLTIDGAFHYGWIGLTNSGGFIDVFAWGYETEAGVGIAAGAPSPGPMALLAVGAVGALGRRGRAA